MLQELPHCARANNITCDVTILQSTHLVHPLKILVHPGV